MDGGLTDMRIVLNVAGLLLMFGFVALVAATSIAIIFAVGLGASNVVHWLVPAISLDAGFIAGVIAAVAASYVVYRVMGLSTQSEDEDDEDSSERKDKVIYVVDQFDLPRSQRRRASRRQSPPPKLP
jgi:membrane protein implicated in regulation of membrane protease activity